MSDNPIPQQILVIAGPSPTDHREREPRRGPSVFRLPTPESVDITALQGQVNIFLQQMDVIMTNTPEKIGGLHLTEFEVSAGIVVEAKGKVNLVLLGAAEAGGGLNAGLKFVFKRS